MDSSGTTDASECEQPLSKPYLVPVVFDREPSSKGKYLKIQREEIAFFKRRAV